MSTDPRDPIIIRRPNFIRRMVSGIAAACRRLWRLVAG